MWEPDALRRVCGEIPDLGVEAEVVRVGSKCNLRVTDDDLYDVGLNAALATMPALRRFIIFICEAETPTRTQWRLRPGSMPH